MLKIQFVSEITCYENQEEWSDSITQLMSQAYLASKAAYAPYSKFYVGAVVELEDGTLVQGSNQENAAYPSGLCAERVALFAASHHHADTKIRSINITANSSEHNTDEPVVPCGACLQVISEYEKKQDQKITIRLHGNNGKIFECNGIRNLMPLTFDLK